MTWFAQDTHALWLRLEGARLLAFGRRGVLTTGGAAWLDRTGQPDGSRPTFTWITCRMAHVYAVAGLQGVPGARDVAAAMVEALAGPLRDTDAGGWVESRSPERGPEAGPDDERKTLYTHAFVVLAAASGTAAGLPGAADLLHDALAVLDGHFWEEDAGAHRDTWDRAFTTCEDYRGTNGNMHAVEALMAASDATGEPRWRHRALRIAARLIDGQARSASWRIPEHFDGAWNPIPDYNLATPADPFKPYGATVGHGLEWSRLLLHLHAAHPGPWLVEASRALYHRAVTDGWDVDGAPGFVYTTDWLGKPVVRTRMHWVVAEAIAAAAALHATTGEAAYAADYARWWDYAATHLIDTEHGSWHHELDEHNRPAATVWAGKPDLYHAFQATVLPLVPLDVGLAHAVVKSAADDVRRLS